MYSKEEIKETKTLFYTSFGKYMNKNKSLEGKRIKWMNYPTRVKHIYTRLHVDKKSASLFIDLQHRDNEIRELFYEQFMELKTVFTSIMGDTWIWEKNALNDSGLKCSRISIVLVDVNLFEKKTWPDIFNFFEENLVNFDQFWNEFKDLFKQLED